MEKGVLMYFLDPRVKSVEPCYCLGTFYEENKPDLINITVLIIPKEDREKPLAGLDTSRLNQIKILCPKNESLILVGTRPPTLYATTKEELETWVKFH